MQQRLVAILLGGLCLVGAGLLLLRPRTEVTVTVTNETARPLAWVALDHEHGGERVDHLAARKTRVLRFRPRGETTFRLRARFEDGAQFSREDHYAEAGYRFYVAIRDTGIVTEVRLAGP